MTASFMQPRPSKIRPRVQNVLLLIALFAALYWPAEAAAGASEVSAPAEVPTKHEPVAVVRFELYHNRIYVPVAINGSSAPATFIIDTGASMSALSEVQAETLGIELRNKGDIRNAGNGEGSIHIAQARNVQFRLGGADLLAKTVGVVPFQSWARFEGRTVAGVLGADLFKRYVVEIDYDNKTVTLFEPSSYVFSEPAEVMPLKLLGGSIPVIEATVEVSKQRSLKANLAIDVGTYSGLRLNRPYIEQHKLLAAMPKLVPSLGFGLEGDFREVLGRLQGLWLGTSRIENPLTSFSQSTSGRTTTKAFDGSIGGEVLRQFKVTLDYSRKQVLVQPSGNPGRAAQDDMSGVVLVASIPDFSSIRIYRVFEGTPAAESGLQEGDLLLAIDNRSAADLGLEGIRVLLNREGLYDLRIKRGDQEMQLRLATRKLI